MRYCRIVDIVGTELWRNKNNLTAYYYITCRADYKSKKLKKSLRNMATEMGMSLSALRFALEQLKREKLIKCETEGNRTVITLPTNLLEKETMAAEVTNPLQTLRKYSKKIEETLKIKPGVAHPSFQLFIDLQELREKKWKTEKELVSHFTNWWLKADAKKVAATARQAQQQEAEQQEEQRKQITAAAAEQTEKERANKMWQELEAKAASGDNLAKRMLAKHAAAYEQWKKEKIKIWKSQQ